MGKNFGGVFFHKSEQESEKITYDCRYIIYAGGQVVLWAELHCRVLPKTGSRQAAAKSLRGLAQKSREIVRQRENPGEVKFSVL